MVAIDALVGGSYSVISNVSSTCFPRVAYLGQGRPEAHRTRELRFDEAGLPDGVVRRVVQECEDILDRSADHDAVLECRHLIASFRYRFF